MTEEDWRSGEKRRTRRRLDWGLVVASVLSIFFAYFLDNLGLWLNPSQVPADYERPATAFLRTHYKHCSAKDAYLGQSSRGPTHADTNTANEKIKYYIITHSLNARNLDSRSSCYSVAAISMDKSRASYQLIYNKSTGKLLKTCLPAIKGDNSGCKDGTWE